MSNGTNIPHNTTRIEVILDAGTRSHRMRNWVDTLREFCDEVAEQGGPQVEVVYRDTAQVFHEKTKFINPELAPDNMGRWPREMRDIYAAIQAGHYVVDAPGEAEQEYYAATRRLIESVTSDLPDEGDLEGLQSKYIEHIARLPKSSALRKTEAFADYKKVRADCGEKSVEEAVAKQQAPEHDGQHTFTLFVSQDQEARKRVEEAGILRRNESGTSCFEAHGVSRDDARDMMRLFVQHLRAQNPQVAEIPFEPDAKQEKFTERSAEENVASQQNQR